MEADQYRVVWTRSAQPRPRAIVAEILLVVKRYRIIFHVAAKEVVIDTIVFPYEVFRPEYL